MNPRDYIIRNVPIPSSLANQLTTQEALREFGRKPMELTLDGELCGTFAIASLSSEWDDSTRTMITRVDLKPYE